MSIDGIGAGAPPGGIGGPRGPSGPIGPRGAGESFSVERGEQAERAGGSPALARLERGEIGLDQYLDESVADAVRHLEKRLPPEQLEFVRDSLRDQLRTDPVLIELVKRATGSAPADERR
jgi:hypothetical protein